MNIIETKKLEQIDSIGIWSQERIMNMCAHIIMASNEIQKYEKVCGDELDVGEDLFTVLQTAPLMYEGVLNGVIKVHLNSDLEPNSAVIHHGDTGIKLIFVGLLKQLPAFAQEDYHLNKKVEEANKKAKEICRADGEAIAKYFDETLSADTIIKQLEDEDPNRKVTSIKIYRDEHGDKSVLVGFKGKSNYESGVIYIKRPSMLQILIYRLKSLFRKKKSGNGIELYREDLNNE